MLGTKCDFALEAEPLSVRSERIVDRSAWGRHLYLVVYELGKDNRYFIELPADQIEVVEPKKETA